MSKKFKVARGWLLFWCLFIGIGAVAGATGMFVDTTGHAMGMDKMLPSFQVLPFADVLFQDFLFPGVALLIVNGITNLVAAYYIIRKKKLGLILGTIFGFTLMLWISIQFCIFEFNFMSTSYFIFGIIQLITGYTAFVYYKQDAFKFSEAEYPKIGKNKDELVIYYSRTGYTKKYAYALANKLGADVVGITATERTKGFLGFMWCGRFGMQRMGMPIENVEIDLSVYKKVTICSPIWVFSYSAPIREFLKYAKGKITDVDYVLVHFMRASFIRSAKQMDEMLLVKHKKYTSVCMRMGEIKSEKEFLF